MTSENTELNYRKLGLSCGLEIHQQLDTKKLFCNCDSTIIKDNTKPNKILKRKLFARTSEAGEKDVSADIEQKKNKTFVYNCYNSCNCLVETDSQPPMEINKDALNLAIIISLLTNSNFVNAGHVMRKQVIDGSNVSGFQRTLMVSTDGFLEFDFGDVRINKILLEEDSARPITKTEKEVFYSLDRQGTPLIELVVWHDIHTPEDTKKVAKDVGDLFRRTGKTKRGLGSIRQDINISIKEGARVEIKGTQDLNLIPEVVKREVIRQVSLIDIKNKLFKKKISSVVVKPKNLSSLFSNTSCEIISKAIKNNKQVYGYKISEFKGILGTIIQPNRRAGTELASILKAQTNIKGIIHLDELPNYNLLEEDIKNIKRELDVHTEDSFILVTCDDLEIDLVTEIISKRINQFFMGVPEETRVVTPEGNTEYQRPLSSGTRMYPETDLKPVVFTKELINIAKRSSPKTVSERKKIYIEKYKLSEQLTSKMVLSNYASVFEEIAENTEINATTVAVFLLEDLKRASRENKIKEKDISKEKIKDFFLDKNIKHIPKAKIVETFIYFIKNDCSVEEATKTYDLLSDVRKIDADEILDSIILENKDFIIKQKERATNFVVGQYMKVTKGTTEAKHVLEKARNKVEDFLNSLKK